MTTDENSKALLAQFADQLNKMIVPTTDGGSMEASGGLLDYSAPPRATAIGLLKMGLVPTEATVGGRRVTLDVPRLTYVERQKGESGEWKNTVAASFDATPEQPMIVYPVGIMPSHLRRSFMPIYEKGATGGKPLCRSTEGIYPDTQFKGAQVEGTTLSQCCALDTRTNRLVDVCPFAAWRTDASGRSIPPRCTVQYPVAVVFSIPDGAGNLTMTLAEISFQRSSATEGKRIVYELAQMQARNQPLYTRALAVWLVPAGASHRIAGRMVFNPSEISGEDKAALEEMAARWQETVAFRIRQARAIPEEEGGEELAF